MTTDDWHHLYNRGWKGLIILDAFTHPAKYSRRLIEHIYQHCLVEAWLNAGDSVVDPFGGVALGGLDAMRLGLHWTGCELEPHFVTLGNENIALWNRRYAAQMPGWGTARLVQGDSRRLAGILAAADCAVSSPPYSNSIDSKNDDGIDWSKARRTMAGGGQHQAPGRSATASYGAAIGSPPFIQTSGGTGVKPGAALGSPTADPRLIARHTAGNAAAHAYGDSGTNLANMTEGEFGAVVTSPPYEKSDQDYAEGWKRFHDGHTPKWANDRQREARYGDSAGQLVAAYDFWHAARAIVEQTYSVLRPGGHAVWVVKAFVRNHQIVDFPGQWRYLCEAVGLETLHEHHAILVEYNGTQLAHDGQHKARKVARKSFFRRLAESRGSPAIDWEVVLCMVKPAARQASQAAVALASAPQS